MWTKNVSEIRARYQIILKDKRSERSCLFSWYYFLIAPDEIWELFWGVFSAFWIVFRGVQGVLGECFGEYRSLYSG